MKEQIAGTNIVIEWTLGQKIEVIKGNWAEYEAIGSDQFGHEYIGSTQTYLTNPEIKRVNNIEMI